MPLMRALAIHAIHATPIHSLGAVLHSLSDLSQLSLSLSFGKSSLVRVVSPTPLIVLVETPSRSRHGQSDQVPRQPAIEPITPPMSLDRRLYILIPSRATLTGPCMP